MNHLSLNTFTATVLCLLGWTIPSACVAEPTAVSATEPTCDVESLRLAIDDLMETFGTAYPKGQERRDRLADLAGRAADAASTREALHALARDALLANPLLDFDRLLLLKRKRGQLGLPTNHQCNTTLARKGYDNEIAVLAPVRPEGSLSTLYRPDDSSYVGELDLHFAADRLLFTMSNNQTWEVHEIGIDGNGLRRVTPVEAGVDNFDACYLPCGDIVYASTACYTAVPCWHGKERACSLYRITADGGTIRQLCFDQDLDLHPSVLPNGQVIFSRWEYTGILHAYLRPLMVMNPDGTNQRAIYGSNSYYPNSLYFPRAIGGSSSKLAAVLTGYHGINRAGQIAVLDTQSGWQSADGVVHRLMHRDEPAEPIIRDNLLNSQWPRYLHPYPLSEKYFLVAAQARKKDPWGIYLVDVFDNMIPIQVDERFDFFEPIPVRRRERPPVIPDKVDPSRKDATVYLHDVYAGPGLAGVPRGSVKRLRVVAYHYGYPGMAGPDKIGRGGPFEAMRILGTVPVHEDGSAHFRIPANTPISLQPLDAEGKALQLMRSWYTAMPGERASCVGCHEQPRSTPMVRRDIAATLPIAKIEPWRGPARGFDFEREVQPVLDKFCVGCHDGSTEPDLRGERFAADYRGLPLSSLGAERLHPQLREVFPIHDTPSLGKGSLPEGDRRALYTPAYDALSPFIRRVNVEDQVSLLVPGHYHADTSELVQILKKGHHGVQLDSEAWDRLITWIDLNGPCHGTWGEVHDVPDGADRSRFELASRYGGPEVDPEVVPVSHAASTEPVLPVSDSEPSFGSIPRVAGWPFDVDEARRRQKAGGPDKFTVELDEGIVMRFTRIPAGRFVMGSNSETPEERPLAEVAIPRDFWIGTCEVTNAQMRCFNPDHDSGVFTKRSIDINGPGVALNAPDQPAVAVSWNEAMDFCRWLSERTGRPFTLPTEAQWEYACRAGTATPLSYGTLDGEFSGFANLADRFLSKIRDNTSGLFVLQEIPCDTRFDDGALATAAVGSYQPNAWGLLDMHGNAAEWTLSLQRPYPYFEDDGRNDPAREGRRVVRGGSFHDRPRRATSSYRLAFPQWQRIHNVGFRVACEVVP